MWSLRSSSRTISIARCLLNARGQQAVGVARYGGPNAKIRRHTTSSAASSSSKPTAEATAAMDASKTATQQQQQHLQEEQNLFQRTHNRGPVSWTSLFLAGVAAASAVAYFQIERERRLEEAMGKVVSSESEGWTPKPEYLAKRKFIATKFGWFPQEDGFGAPGKPAIGGPWSLVDLEGNLVTNKSFEGKWLLLYFGFARCPDICPSEMQKVGRVMDTLKEKYPELYKKVVPVFVTVDPARDSIQNLKSFAKDFHPDYVFLTGSPLQVQEMAKKYRVYVSKAEESDEDYLVDHSIVIYFHDDTGDLADCFTQSMRYSDVVEKVVERMTFKPKY